MRNLLGFRLLRLALLGSILLLVLVARGCGGGGGSDGNGGGGGTPPPAPSGEFHFPTDLAWTGTGNTEQPPGRSDIFRWLATDQDDPPYPVHNSHLGIDISGPTGAAVYAVTDGTVVANNTAEPDVLNKNLWIRHDLPGGGRFYAVYGHVTSSVRAGTRVSVGQRVAGIASQGNSHLHLGIRPSGIAFPWGRGTIPAGWRLSEDPGKSRLPRNGFVAPRSYLSEHLTGI